MSIRKQLRNARGNLKIVARRPKVVKEVIVQKVPRRKKKINKRVVSGSGTYGIGERLGRSAGGFLGRNVDQLADYLLSGFGDYNINNNTLLHGGMDPPTIANSTKNGGIIVRHREYISDVFSTVNFTLTSFNINPGLNGSFPWLAQIASSFEQYSLRGMIFEFKTTSSDVVLSTNATTALGAVIMATQYNALDIPFVDKRTMENYQYSNSSKPSESMLHPIECARAQTSVDNLYVRVGAVPPTADLRLYDMGIFNIATVGMQNNGGVIGELWASFEIEFYKPKLLLGDVLTDHWQLKNVTNAAPFGLISTLTASSTLGTTISASGLIITFPATVVDGNFLFEYTVFGTGAPVTQFNLPTQFNIAALRVWENDTSLYEGTRTATTTNVYSFSQLYQIQGPSATLTFTAPILPTSVSAGDLWITQVAEPIIT